MKETKEFMRGIQIINKTEIKFIERHWYENLPRLSSSEFTYENSGGKNGDAHPFSQSIDGSLKPINCISNLYNILGYTLNPPYGAPFEYVAIMFERKDDFSKVWFHYNK